MRNGPTLPNSSNVTFAAANELGEAKRRPLELGDDVVGNEDHSTSLANCPTVEMRPILDLRPHPRNVRKYSKSHIRRLAGSIQALTFNVPVLTDSNDQILAGAACVDAAKMLGMTHVPVISLHHLSEAQALAFMFAHNKLAEGSTWDEKKLAIQLRELSEMTLSFEIEASGFERAEIDLRIQSLADIDAIDRADRFEVAAGPPVSAKGDFWQLGEHRVLCENALDPVALSRLFDGEKATATFTDPPYNVKIDGHAGGKGAVHHHEFPMASGEMSESEFTDFLTSALNGICKHVAPGGLIYVCMDWRHAWEMLTAGRSCNCVLLNIVVWVKTNAGMGSHYRSQHEFVFVLKNGPHPHLNNIQLGKFSRNRSNVWHFAGSNGFARKGSRRNLELHPTVKPPLLVADAIQDSTNRGDIVFDPFLGSGTTLLAAEYTGRRCYGIELDPRYVDTAIERWQRMTGQKAHNQLGETFETVKVRRRASDE